MAAGAAVRSAKRAKLLSSSETESESESDSNSGLQFDAEYGRRFEHNKKREEKQRLEEKYGKESESSSDETEDDDGELATATLDQEIATTLRALREKDPRVYDKKTSFYTSFEPGAAGPAKEKPMHLRDYHRENLLNGHVEGEDGDGDAPLTYRQGQDQLRDALKTAAESDDGEESEADGFLVAKPSVTSKAAAKALTEADVLAAEKDPDAFLNNFIDSRPWVSTDGQTNGFQPMESDDSEEEDRAEEFEQAWNMRFEDPMHANEKLQTFSRATVDKHSVRRKEKNARQNARDRERERKEAAKKEKEAEKARWRKLKIEEIEDKVNRIKATAGIDDVADIFQWKDLLEGDFSDKDWDKEMERRFGEKYYADVEGEKPEFGDEIDISYLENEEEEEDAEPAKKSRKELIQERSEAKRAARKQRRQVEELVDSTLIPEPEIMEKASGFRYRETSPTSFGMTARDILFASDAQLNQYAGLKKLATFRPEEKKRKDKKRLGKKARLRQWRKEVYGSAEEPKGGFEDHIMPDADEGAAVEKKKKNRKRKRKDKVDD
ncbi:Krr1-domain-containing protein [Piedraia hortae CBS 480.64]|uniref:Krr1-domain-containing protein n=1 Tax=Piedraia hortae CBS 480.64 TaxID=1314780 RepID=A0A6A7BSP2_9PEZI|nr:Krr1-domain-containing protein [Piedraia hortae CBS 480.64]